MLLAPYFRIGRNRSDLDLQQSSVFGVPLDVLSCAREKGLKGALTKCGEVPSLMCGRMSFPKDSHATWAFAFLVLLPADRTTRLPSKAWNSKKRWQENERDVVHTQQRMTNGAQPSSHDAMYCSGGEPHGRTHAQGRKRCLFDTAGKIDPRLRRKIKSLLPDEWCPVSTAIRHTS